MPADAVLPGRISVVLGAIFAGLFYLATAVLLVGVGARVARYARTPAPLVIPTTPAPTTHAGVFIKARHEFSQKPTQSIQSGKKLPGPENHSSF